MPARKTTNANRKTGKARTSTTLLVPEKLATLVHYLRHDNVILDSDLAELYGVPTKVLNQAVKRNIGRFPEDFMIQLTAEEIDALILKNGTLSPNRSQLVTGSQKHRDPRYLPYAFTEQGVAMLSNVLHSPRAVEVNIAIMRTFVQLRRLMDSNALLAESLFFSAFQTLSVSAFTSRTRLPHPPIRHFREKANPDCKEFAFCGRPLKEPLGRTGGGEKKGLSLVIFQRCCCPLASVERGVSRPQVRFDCFSLS